MIISLGRKNIKKHKKKHELPQSSKFSFMGERISTLLLHSSGMGERMPEEWRRGVCLSQSIKTKGTHSAVETTEE